MRKLLVLFVLAVAVFLACNAQKTVDPTGRGPIPKGIRESQKDTSITGAKRDTAGKQ
ncbi:hypothetical protein [Hufsiella ginkgonis]|uniref:Quinol oxidase subunit 4 n=1 Tax=Hufsiella ginkgonis TaxID=2695274 RepID=A0A7K1XYX5_9SPHI|nr:hypothetical protein [Hufsiella ginkgonis]MXV16204.1 hypothetical protein [Hufsiella ginkgonis]